MKEKKEVIKHSAAIHIGSNITLLQRRAWNVLLANAYDELPAEEEHRIRVHDLMRVLEFDSKNEDYLKEALKALTTCGVEWNVLDKDGEEEWGATTLLAQAKIQRGTCTYAYSPELRRRLHNPRIYARISLSMQNKFDSKHAQALWEACVDYLGTGRDYGETPFIPLATYRQLMGVSEDQYTRFKDLNLYVIKASVEEINRVTDFHVTVEYQRAGRKVTAVKFKVRRVLVLPEANNRQGALFQDLEDMPPVVKELKNAGLSSKDAWEIWQHGVDYIEADAKPDAEGFDAYLREKIHLMKRRQDSGKVKNSTGFLLEAIKQNYANPEFAKEKKQREAQKQAQDQKAKARALAVLQEQRDQVKRAYGDALHAHCQAMIAASPALLEEAVTALQAEDRTFSHYYRQDYWPNKTPEENYAHRPTLYVPIDNFLTAHYPERFQALHDAHSAELAALDEKIAALAPPAI
jgi:hypothetical protein